MNRNARWRAVENPRQPMLPRPDRDALLSAYKRLFEHYGPQSWWPANSAVARRGRGALGEAPGEASVDEIAIGAVLVQHTSWRNVEHAIERLADSGVTTLAEVSTLAEHDLAERIRPAGPPSVKAKRLLAVAAFANRVGGLSTYLSDVRDRRVALRKRGELLGVHGVGPETADCLLLYGGGAPLPVVDAYLRRVLRRHGWLDADAPYDALAEPMAEVFGEAAQRHNEWHALIVRLGVEHCKARRPRCAGCALESLLPCGGPASE